MPKRNNGYGKPKPTVSIPRNRSKSSQNSPRTPKSGGVSASPVTPVTPKTPADEGIDFFQSEFRPGEIPVRVYELRLDSDGGPKKERAYIRLPPAYKPYILRVYLEAGTPASKNGIFKTNFPLDGGAFGRDRFAERKLPTDLSKPIKIDLPISHAGAFVFWVEYDGQTTGERIKGREGYFNIDPILRSKERSNILSSDGEILPLDKGAVLTEKSVNVPLDGLSILSIVSKWMGPISEWRAHFLEARRRGYTMLHYTPLQERGDSNSPYSVRRQLVYDARMFPENEAPSREKGNGDDGGLAQVEEILRVARDDYGLLSLTDVVLNHTAPDSPWLVDHPEAGFSPSNSPHLTPAVELDTLILAFSKSLASRGLPTRISSEGDIETIANALKEEIKKLNLWQYYVLDPEREQRDVFNAFEKGTAVVEWGGGSLVGKSTSELADMIHASGKISGHGDLASRFGVRVEPGVAIGILNVAYPEERNSGTLAGVWKKVADIVNVQFYREWEEDERVAIENIRNRVRYTRLEEGGPKMGEITESKPLVEPYFTRIYPKSGHDPLKHSLANNGWIWNADPLANFAEKPSKAYLRREVIVWGDCVKLRYGKGPEDNPWLWKYMTMYIEALARTFDGFRVDNCHSTPLHVGITLMDAARVIKPDLYVCAELFTGNEETDVYFVSRLGINSLVRESGNAWDAKELSRLLYRNGLGKPLGSMDDACTTSLEELAPPTGKGPTRPCVVTPLTGSTPHALLYDLTHDNESPRDKRTAEDALSAGALVTFAKAAVGSVKGFDDLYPKLLDLVSEKRLYDISSWETGIGRAKRLLNSLHWEMMTEGFDEGHVHQENDYIVMHRVQPKTQKGYLLIAHTAFGNSKGSKDRGWINPIKLRRTKARFVFGAALEISSYEESQDPDTLYGLPSKLVDIPLVQASENTDSEGFFSELTVPSYFPPGSILVFSTQMDELDSSLEAFCMSGAPEAFSSLSLVDLNVILYRADGEERDATDGEIGAYEVPGLGKAVYCGLEGWMHPLRHIVRHNDLGHPLCEHLRSGTWALDYVHSRLTKQTNVFPNLKAPVEWFKERFERIKTGVPPFMRPKFFALVIFEGYRAARRAVMEQCSNFISTGHELTQDLAFCAVQMYGQVKSASLDPGKPTPSLAAGLPHFTSGWARCWGRDVFISLRGLFLTTGNFGAAKAHILSFASTLKHGLIPNLLDSVRNPRYNSRDSPWWMLQNIQDYVTMAPDGLSILQEAVQRRFPKDDSWVAWDDMRAYSYGSTVAEIIQEILQRHAEGISFREYNAGPNLDMQMKDEGFNIDIKVDWKTGLIHGGNQHNCGTWMDKMGESVKAGTKGVPGTPRDGAPVEITGLLKSTLRWLDELSQAGKFPFHGVKAEIDGETKLIKYSEWGSLLQQSFEKCYYVPEDPTEDSKYNINSQLVNRRGIYKDVFGSGAGREWSDYQFRPNFPIAMTVAPELFHEGHALGALKLADRVLRAPLGMKTLDPSDMQYRPDYDNQNDSSDASIAKGLNYHNGPEWGWPLGYFLRAYLHFDLIAGVGKQNAEETLHKLYNMLLTSRHHIQNDQWAGLPELTNKDGKYCADSCATQAWSASTLLDFLEAASSVQTKN